MKTPPLLSLITLAGLTASGFAQEAPTAPPAPKSPPTGAQLTNPTTTDGTAQKAMEEMEERTERLQEIEKKAEAAVEGKPIVVKPESTKIDATVSETEAETTSPLPTAGAKAMNPVLEAEDSPALTAISEAEERAKKVEEITQRANRAATAEDVEQTTSDAGETTTRAAVIETRPVVETVPTNPIKVVDP